MLPALRGRRLSLAWLTTTVGQKQSYVLRRCLHSTTSCDRLERWLPGPLPLARTIWWPLFSAAGLPAPTCPQPAHEPHPANRMTWLGVSIRAEGVDNWSHYALVWECAVGALATADRRPDSKSNQPSLQITHITYKKINTCLSLYIKSALSLFTTLPFSQPLTPLTFRSPSHFLLCFPRD